MDETTSRSRRSVLKALLGLAAVTAVGGATLLTAAPAEAATPPLPTPAPAPAETAAVAPESELPRAEPTYWVRRRRYYRRRRVVVVRRRRIYRRRRYYY